MLGEVVEVDTEILGIELAPHQKEAGFFVRVLIGVQNVPVMAINKVGDGRDFALAVGTGDEQDGGVFHPSVSFLATLAKAGLRVLISSKDRTDRCKLGRVCPRAASW